ncbi:hypothetical protein QR680_015748 [Steinernema hermaphroditum]|uniref:Uncharacterized protein n=1 Tax=Steinernema hermaphroditum TaxID=289476 RepID=A0AA39H8U0_9BILA|nr:hypothetical protein QR680_015748 [Steinernema hermaphroditum]
MTSIKALMGQLGKELYRKLNITGKAEFALCLDSIDNERDLTHGARCLLDARRKCNTKTYERRSADNSEISNHIRTRTDVYQEQRKQLLKKKPKMRRAKRSEHRLGAETSHHHRRIRTMNEFCSLAQDARPSPIRKVANLVAQLAQGQHSNYQLGDWLKTYKKLLNFKETMDRKNNNDASHVFHRRLFDLALDTHHRERPTEKRTAATIVDAAISFIESVSGKRKREIRERSNVRLLSPRVAPLMPDKLETKSRPFSPSVLSFYRDDVDGGIASIPKVLEATGMTNEDRDAMIEMLMEVSGARKNVNMALDILNQLNFKGLKGEILEVTERLSTAFANLENSFLKYQKDEIAARGFTFLEAHQIDKLYRDHGLSAADDVNFDLAEYRNLNRLGREEALWKRLELLARNRTQIGRRKRAFQLVSVLSPTLLSPFMFSPVFGLSVLGPVVLSPNIFSPLILNPTVLGPYVMSPAIAMPFILSPYLLSPYVMTPIVMAPFILNPYVLSPNVLNPYLLSPIILSPLVLCPDILSPQALGGAILSPSVGSPAVLTESFFMANILSPSFLS